MFHGGCLIHAGSPYSNSRNICWICSSVLEPIKRFTAFAVLSPRFFLSRFKQTSLLRRRSISFHRNHSAASICSSSVIKHFKALRLAVLSSMIFVPSSVFRLRRVLRNSFSLNPFTLPLISSVSRRMPALIPTVSCSFPATRSSVWLPSFLVAVWSRP